jgi:hypothetical protein
MTVAEPRNQHYCALKVACFGRSLCVLGRPEGDGFNIPLKGNLAAMFSQYRDCG